MNGPISSITFKPVGTVHNEVSTPVDTGWGSVESSIILHPEWAEGLAGLEDFSHVVVLTHLHRVAEQEPETPVKRRPRNREDMPLLGVFAQRARVRPNPIGITACPIVRVGKGELVVRGLDAIDGTPVLDIKPYIPHFDRVESPCVPEWVAFLSADYN